MMVARVGNKPQTIGEAINMIRRLKTSPAIEKRMFGKFNDQAYEDFATGHFAFVTQFARGDQQAAFTRLVRDQVNGRARAEDVDRFIGQLRTPVIAKAPPAPPHKPPAAPPTVLPADPQAARVATPMHGDFGRQSAGDIKQPNADFGADKITNWRAARERQPQAERPGVPSREPDSLTPAGP